MFVEFLTVSGWIFWVAVTLIALLAAFMSAEEAHSEAVVVVVVALLGVTFFTDAFDGQRVSWLVTLFFVHLFLGVCWATKKWYDFSVDERDRLYDVYDRAAPSDNFSPARTGSREEYARRHKPAAADNKARITNWMLLWPLSVLWWSTTIPRRFVAWVYERLSGVFDRITDKVFSG